MRGCASKPASYFCHHPFRASRRPPNFDSTTKIKRSEVMKKETKPDNGIRGSIPEVKATNPKEAIGSAKLDFSLVPSSAVAYMATAFTEGALKYGAYNWRAAGVRASTYYAAVNRHLTKWWNGENFDPKTRVHHLANAQACLAILLDAELVDMLNDDRPPKAYMAGLIEQLEGTVTHLKKMSEGLTPHHHTALDAAVQSVG